MRLEFKKKYNSGATTVFLNLVDITAEEEAALEIIGILNLVLKKTYSKTNTKVDINMQKHLLVQNWPLLELMPTDIS